MTLTKQSWKDAEQSSSSAFTTAPSPPEHQGGNTSPELSPGWQHSPQGMGLRWKFPHLGVVISCYSPSSHSYHWLQDLLCVLQAGSKGTALELFSWGAFVDVCVVNKDGSANRQVGVGKRTKKPRQINLGNIDLMFSFPLSLLERGPRYEKWWTTRLRYQHDVVFKSLSK